MTYIEILEKYGQIRQTKVLDRLNLLGDTLFGNEWIYTRDNDSQTITTDKGLCKGTEISNFTLIKNCRHNKCNTAGYVYVIKDMFHESRHIQRCVTEWNMPPDGNKISEDIIRRKLVSFCYPSAYTNNYTNDPGEMDAEAYAVEKSLEYFKSDPLVDENEAKTILFEFMTSEDYYNKDIFKGHSPGSIDDVLKILKEHRETAADILYEVTDKIEPGFENCINVQTDLTEKFLYSDKFESYRKAYDACTTGTQRDKVLEQTLLLLAPDADKYVKRLEPELSERKTQMQDKIRAYYMGLAECEAVYPNEIEDAERSREFTEGVRSISSEDLKL